MTYPTNTRMEWPPIQLPDSDSDGWPRRRMTLGEAEAYLHHIVRIIAALGGDSLHHLLYPGADLGDIYKATTAQLVRIGYPDVHHINGMRVDAVTDFVSRWAGCIDHDDCRANRELARACAAERPRTLTGP